MAQAASSRSQGTRSKLCQIGCFAGGQADLQPLTCPTGAHAVPPDKIEVPQPAPLAQNPACAVFRSWRL